MSTSSDRFRALVLAAMTAASSVGACGSSTSAPAPRASAAAASGSTTAVDETPSPECKKLCESNGLCGFDGKRCVARTDVDCKHSQLCFLMNRCAARDGRCFLGAPSDERCNHASKLGDEQMPSECERSGECHAKDGACRATDAAACKASALCSTRGLCDLGEGRCIAASKESCLGSQYCKVMGECALAGEDCVATAESCPGSSACATSGACHFVAAAGGPGSDTSGSCEPLSDADCKDTSMCKLLGECAFAGGRCVKPDDPCSHKHECEAEGLCTTEKKKCVAKGRDCEKSTACTLSGRCEAKKGECVRL